MIKNRFLGLITIALALLFSNCQNQKNQHMQAPIATKKPHAMTEFGNTRIDNYYWLNNRENPEVIAYLETENAYTKQQLKDTESLQEKIYNEIVGRMKQTDISVPYKRNGYYYYTRQEEGKEYSIYCRKKGTLEAEEEILLNGNEMAEGYAYFAIGGMSISSNNNVMAYSVDTVSRRQYTIYFKDLITGKIFEETIKNTTGNITWANDNKTVFYSLKDETLRSDRILTHTLGTNPVDDKIIFHEVDPTFFVFAYKTKSQRYIMIGSESTLSSEYYFIDADNPEQGMTLIQKRQNDLLYSVDHYKNDFYIRTNANGALNFKLVKTPVTKPNIENWKDLIAHRKEVMIESFDIFSNYLVLSEREDGLTKIRVKTWDEKTDYYIDFDDPTYTAYIGTNLDFDSEILRFGYTSMTTPNSVYDFNMRTKERELLKRQEIVGGYNPDDYESLRLYATSHDGAKVPISLVYKKGLKKDGNNPLVLYGYGSYGYSMDVSFSSARLSLLDRGFVWAIAHIRGGEEMGRAWYEDGKLLKKKNTFFDFIACGKDLIAEKFTNSDKMFAMGGSAGGLLVGAIANMEPQLWKGIVAQVPFVDVVTTMLDESIPLTTGEYDEWGNPNKKEYYDYMLSYSPYDNVEAKDYPAMLVTTGLHDSQVQYWEPAKWVAKLRDMKTDNNTLLLETNMEVGHGGASGRFESVKEVALEYAFMLQQLGIKE